MPSRRRRKPAHTAFTGVASLALAGFLAFHHVLPDPAGWLSVLETAIP